MPASPSRGGPFRTHRVAIVASLGILLAQAARIPELTDPLGNPVPDRWQLSTPWLHTLGSPLFSLWDQVAMLSRSRLSGLLLGLAVGYLAWRVVARWHRRVRWQRAALEEGSTLLVAIALFGAFVAIGMAWNTRPARRLVGLGSGEFTVEVHSHSSVSHDVKSWPVAGFDVEQSRAWHQRAGVDVLFVTDHNLTTGWERTGLAETPGQLRLCPGVEISAFGAHVVVLGTPLPADPAAYRGSAENRARLFREVRREPGAIAIASLPEYRGKAAEFLAEGVGGFEVVNASPKANELSRRERDSVVALARRHGVAVVAAGDQHGYGATPMAWNVMREPRWWQIGDGLCAAVVAQLRAGGVTAVQIVERSRLRPDHPLPGFLTPLGALWMAWATLSLGGVLSWLAWLWGLTLLTRALIRRLREHRARAILTAVGAVPSSSTRRT